jgi:hypothetical protein
MNLFEFMDEHPILTVIIVGIVIQGLVNIFGS